MRVSTLLFALAPALALAACATPQSLSLESAEADPWEATNRRVYALNKKLDRYAVKPVTQVYRAAVPPAGRTAVTNVYQNYSEPRNFMGYLLQGKVKLAFRSLDRLIINTTLGIGGLADNATDLGRPQSNTDWGQTLAMWGVKPGPYVMLPFFGPGTLRDALMTPVDFVLDPADIARNAALSPSLYWRAGQITGRVVELRSRLIDAGGDAVLADSLDEYTLIKSAYLQRRRAQLYYGNPPPTAEELAEYEEAEAADPEPVPEAEAAPAPPPEKP
ncbi:hypothetical protein GCM10007973_07110 [Polymorphobacter multimanifer]|uniref:MlaA family lipoprotein n=1 Tax=Polymorphobacter multimanifer TaxID=1070431 RepID=UPI0019B9E489|nr:VacJ family lipoprotein [Polymorphobacter multimanifer]GGI72726.1 hypothetical protein GCM10007973_07110 [Polymorphobacter multimanifer]